MEALLIGVGVGMLVALVVTGIWLETRNRNRRAQIWRRARREAECQSRPKYQNHSQADDATRAGPNGQAWREAKRQAWREASAQMRQGAGDPAHHKTTEPSPAATSPTPGLLNPIAAPFAPNDGRLFLVRVNLHPEQPQISPLQPLT